jgi:hypothetical protein
MTQDQWGQPVNPGQVVRGEVVPNDESGAPPPAQAPPMTRFEKVAGRADPPASQDADETAAEEERAVSSPDAGRGDYWDIDEDAPEAEPAEEPADAPAAPAVSAVDTAADASTPAVADEAGPAAAAGQAEEIAHETGPDGHDAMAPSMTPPNAFGTASRPMAADVPTVPIRLAGESAGDGGRPAESAAAGTAAAETAGAETAAGETGLRPGESGTTLGRGESGYASLVTDTADLREQWHQIQYKFVDDPRVSVTEAADVIAQVAARLEAAIAERQRGLRGRWDTPAAVDTETLRETLRMYRAFLDQLIGPEP